MGTNRLQPLLPFHLNSFPSPLPPPPLCSPLHSTSLVHSAFQAGDTTTATMSASSPLRPLSAIPAILAILAISHSPSPAAAQQPTKMGTANTFEVVGTSGVSAQQVLLLVLALVLVPVPPTAANPTPPVDVPWHSTPGPSHRAYRPPYTPSHLLYKQVYIIDKTENNPAQVNGHPAWATGEPTNPFFARLPACPACPLARSTPAPHRPSNPPHTLPCLARPVPFSTGPRIRQRHCSCPASNC
jgi:hypothetical protein